MDTETYLGDAVYASFDGYHIWLRTGDGNAQRIALEPGVFAALVRFKESLQFPLTDDEQREHEDST